MEKSPRFAIVRLEERIAPSFLNIFKLFSGPSYRPAPNPCEPTPVCHPAPAPVCQPTPCFTFALPKFFGCR